MDDTKLLYLDDSYLKTAPALGVGVEDRNVVLDQTVFYARGGGQMADRGVLRWLDKTATVVAVEKRGGSVYHTLEGDLPSVGAEVTGEIDWNHRYRMMRTHTALHVLCGVIWKRYGAQVTGCQMYTDRARMDFTLDDLSSDRVREIERLSNEAVAAGYPVRARYLSRDKASTVPDLVRTKINLIPAHVDPIRVGDIVGLDMQADGGTHVANTLEVGGINVLKTENKGRENRRLEIDLLDFVDPR